MTQLSLQNVPGNLAQDTTTPVAHASQLDDDVRMINELIDKAFREKIFGPSITADQSTPKFPAHALPTDHDSQRSMQAPVTEATSKTNTDDGTKPLTTPAPQPPAQELNTEGTESQAADLMHIDGDADPSIRGADFPQGLRTLGEHDKWLCASCEEDKEAAEREADAATEPQEDSAAATAAKMAQEAAAAAAAKMTKKATVAQGQGVATRKRTRAMAASSRVVTRQTAKKR